MKRYKRLYLLLGVLAVACIATFGVLSVSYTHLTLPTILLV